MKTYTNAVAAKMVCEKVDVTRKEVLDSIDLAYEDNLTDEDVQILVEFFQEKLASKENTKQRENETNEKIVNTRYFKTTWTWDDESISQVILEIEDGKLVVMYDLTRDEEIHDFYDVDAKIAVQNCLKGLNQRLLEHEARIYIKGNWLEKIILEQGITQYEFAKRCDLDRSLINRIINNNTDIGNIQLNTAYAFAKGLGMTLVEFIEKYYTK